MAPRRAQSLHGVFLDILGLGVLITGESGIGKSELALELLSRGHKLVADDAPEFERIAGRQLVGRAPALLQNFLEVRGLGILNIRAMFGARAIRRKRRLELVIRLAVPAAGGVPARDRLSGSRSERGILGVEIPEICLPVMPGHNLSVLVEAACRDHKLRRRGYVASDAFERRQAATLKSES